MRYISLKIIICCIVFPPVAYVATLLCLVPLLENRLSSDIEKHLTGDTHLLLSGSVELADVVYTNVQGCLKRHRFATWGVRTRIEVKNGEGQILYPADWTSPDRETFIPPDPYLIAAKNYSLLSGGLFVTVEMEVNPQGLLSFLLAGCYLILSILFLVVHYRLAHQRFADDVLGRESEIENITESRNKLDKRLNHLKSKKLHLEQEIQRLQTAADEEKALSAKNEDEMIEEILALEKQIEANLEDQITQQEEIERLKAEIDNLKKLKRLNIQHQSKNLETIKKRFGTLYKNTRLGPRALAGYLHLTEDMKIKSEEIIHLLNQDPKLVPVKRKVFGPKRQAAILELAFAYKGRLYYRMDKETIVDILAIGTKNTQTNDLVYLKKLK